MSSVLGRAGGSWGGPATTGVKTGATMKGMREMTGVSGVLAGEGASGGLERVVEATVVVVGSVVSRGEPGRRAGRLALAGRNKGAC